MNVDVLIDSIVRQTTILIAQLATAAGVRAPLSHVANQVFVDLVKELQQQGVGQKVIADMFGMALRSYQAKVRRLSESSTASGESLWEATLRHLQEKGTVSRADVLRRFAADDSAAVAAVLRDLVSSGLVFRSGQGDRAVYRAATPEEYRRSDPEGEREGLLSMILVALNRYAPASSQDLADALPMELASVEQGLDQLVRDGRARELSDEAGKRYECVSCVIPVGSSAGWEAAVFDHFQAMVTALCTKLRLGSTSTSNKDAIGGSTYGFDVWPGHPHRDEVLTLLAQTRQRAVALREKVESYNANQPGSERELERVLFYTGQTLLGQEPEGDDR